MISWLWLIPAFFVGGMATLLILARMMCASIAKAEKEAGEE
jgi:hypothetical protein